MSAATSILRRRTIPCSMTFGSRGAVERAVDRGEAGVLEGLHQVVARLLVVDPAQELPDRLEVLDVVDQRRPGERHEERPRDAGPDPLRELQDVLGPLRGLVLDEVRLVDDHAAEAEGAEPADVPVEDLVVDDDDVGEAVHVVAVAVDHRGRVGGGPDVGLAGPVGLDHVGHDHEQREGVGGLGGEQRLGGLAEAGLVGEQEGAVTCGGGRDDLRLVRHQRQPRLDPGDVGLGERHAGGGAVGGVLEGPQQRLEELPAVEPARPVLAALGRGEVRRHERVGQLPGDDRLRHHLTLHRGRGRVGVVGLLDRLGLLEAGGLLHLAAQRPGVAGDLGALVEQGEQGRVPGGGLGQDGGHAVEPLELLGALRLGGLLVGLHAGALVADEQGDDLERDVGRLAHATALDVALDLAHGLRQDGQDALVVLGSGAPLARRGTGATGLALASSSH